MMLVPFKTWLFKIRAVLSRGGFFKAVSNTDVYIRGVLNMGVFNTSVNLIDLQHATKYVVEL